MTDEEKEKIHGLIESIDELISDMIDTAFDAELQEDGLKVKDGGLKVKAELVSSLSQLIEARIDLRKSI